LATAFKTSIALRVTFSTVASSLYTGKNNDMLGLLLIFKDLIF